MVIWKNDDGGVVVRELSLSKFQSFDKKLGMAR